MGLTLVDTRTRFLQATVVPSKGVGHEWCGLWLAKAIENLGYPTARVRSDQERGILALKLAACKACRTCQLIPEESAAYDSKANRAVEAINAVVEGQVRTLKSATDAALQHEFDTAHPLTCWMVRHAAWLHSHFHLGEDGFTAAQRLRGRRSNRGLLALPRPAT